MPYTTININNLKHVKLEALKRGITLRELVNRAIGEYLSDSPVHHSRSPKVEEAGG